MWKIIFLVMSVLLCLGVNSVFAHPPSAIDITYDGETQVITAIIYHHVRNPETHYIKEAQITINGNSINTLTFDSQDTNREQTIEYATEGLSAGDVITIKATCNKFGSKKKKLKIKEEQEVKGAA